MSDALAAAVLGRTAQPGARLGVGVVATAADSDGVMMVTWATRVVEAVGLTSAVSASVGDPVLLLREGSAVYVVGRIGQPPPPPPEPDPEPTPPPKPTPPKPTYATRTATFRPVFAGSYRGGTGGWRTDTSDVMTGDWTGGYGVSLGRAYYGSGPSGLRKVTKVNWGRVSIRRKSGGVFGGQTLPMVLMSEKTRPGGSGSVRDSANGPSLAVNAETTWTIPRGWAEDLVAGRAGGLGIGTGSRSPYIRTHAPSTWSPGWVLSINYTYQTS